jgi:hypothetical protein
MEHLTSPGGSSAASTNSTSVDAVAMPPVPSGAAASVAPAGAPNNSDTHDLGWVWREVRKRVFLKLPFSAGVADAMEAAHPIALEESSFVVGLSPKSFPLSSHLLTEHVKKTIENILRAAAGRPIVLEVIEGNSVEDWRHIRDRRQKAQEAVVAMARQHSKSHHFDDMLNQIVAEIRGRVTVVKDRAMPQVRAQMLLDIAPTLADAEEMLFPDPDAHDARRAMSRALDRVAGFLDIQPILLAIEVERCRRQPRGSKERPAHDRPNTLDSV